MAIDQIKKKVNFSIIGKPLEVVGGNGNVIVISKQVIDSDDSEPMEFIVLKKIRRQLDGTQTGKVSQVFIQIPLVSRVLDAIKQLSVK